MNEWKPFPKQEVALTRTEFEILYGGSRGGGKTDAGMVWLLDYYKDDKGILRCYIEHPRYRALVLRKNSNDLSDWLDRASYMYKRYGGEVAGNPPVVKFKSGAIFRTGHLKNRESYEKFLGHEYQHLLIEELNQIPDEKYYIQILGSIRSTIPELRPQVFNTTNPGGVGHLWVKERFIDVSPPNKPYKYEMELDIGGVKRVISRARIYIPAQVDDNPALIEKDPGYILYLESLKEKDPDLYRAWRHGDWDVFAGQFFGEFRRETHIVKPFTPRKELIKVGGIDWGYNAEFVFLGSAVEKVEKIIDDDEIKFNRVYTFKEISGTKKSPQEWARKIRAETNLDEYAHIYCDPAMFNRQDDGSESIADQMKVELGNNGYKLVPANNDRLAGWSRMHEWLSLAPDGVPYWLISESCVGLIKTLPALVHDETRVEDVDTDGEDHWADSARYKLVHLKWIDAKAYFKISKVGVLKQVKPTFLHGLDLKKFEKAKPKRKGVL